MDVYRATTDVQEQDTYTAATVGRRIPCLVDSRERRKRIYPSLIALRPKIRRRDLLGPSAPPFNSPLARCDHIITIRVAWCWWIVRSGQQTVSSKPQDSGAPIASGSNDALPPARLAASAGCCPTAVAGRNPRLPWPETDAESTTSGVVQLLLIFGQQ